MSMQTREQMLLDLERKAYLDAIAQARADGERAGIERAAKCADEVAGQQVSYGEVSKKYGDEYSTALHEYAGDSARDLAAAIRSLKVEGQ